MVPQRGGVDTRRRPRKTIPELCAPSESVTQLRPVKKVLAVPNGHRREVLEAGVREVEVFTYAANSGVGVETREDRLFRAGLDRAAAWLLFSGSGRISHELLQFRCLKLL